MNFNLSRRTIFIVVGAIIGAVIIVLGIVFYLSRTPDQPTTPTETPSEQKLPSAGTVSDNVSGAKKEEPSQNSGGASLSQLLSNNGSESNTSSDNTLSTSAGLPRMSQVTSAPVLDYSFSSAGDRLVYMNNSNGTVYSTSFSGANSSQKTFTELEGLYSAEFSPRRDNVLLKLSSDTDPDGIAYRVLSLETGEFTDLHANVQVATWDQSGDHLVYIFYNTDRGYYDFSISAPTGEGYRSLKIIDSSQYLLKPIPGTAHISYYSPAHSLIPSSLRSLSTSSSQESLLLKDRYGFDVLWAPHGQQALLFEAIERGSGTALLSLYNRLTTDSKPLRLQTTIDKVTWNPDGSTLYAAIPDITGDTYPEDYRDNLVPTVDLFAKVDPETGSVEPLTYGSELPYSVSATNLKLSPDGKHLFFINRNDLRLYVVNL